MEHTDTTTGYGTWANHGDSHNLSVAATIEDAFGTFSSDGYNVDAIEADYRDAIDTALESAFPGLNLCGEDFYGPACDHCIEAWSTDQISDVIATIDLWAIIERHDSTTDTEPQTSAPAITRTDLDWLCIVHRAIEGKPTNDTLWYEAVFSLRRLIEAFNTVACDESHAANAQYLLNRLAAIAYDYTTPTVAAWSERIKDALEAIGRGERLDALRLL